MMSSEIGIEVWYVGVSSDDDDEFPHGAFLAMHLFQFSGII